MLEAIWEFVKDPSNRDALKWIGGGVVGAIGGLWAVITFFAKNGEGGPTRNVKADRGGVAAGRDISGSTITTGDGSRTASTDQR